MALMILMKCWPGAAPLRIAHRREPSKVFIQVRRVQLSLDQIEQHHVSPKDLPTPVEHGSK